MTDQCGAPHHDYPQTLCTEPPGHYIPDRDPHAGPLIIDGRECGSAAWDEPKEQPMTDEAWRIDPRERLLAAIDQTWAYGELAATPEQLVDDYAHQLAEQSAALNQVRALYERWVHAGPPPLGASMARWWDKRLVELRTALQPDGAQPAPAGHRYLSTGCLHDQHDYCQSHTGLSGAKRPASCKWCAARCVCPCHQQAATEATEPDTEDEQTGPLVPPALMDAIDRANEEHEKTARALAALDTDQSKEK